VGATPLEAAARNLMESELGPTSTRSECTATPGRRAARTVNADTYTVGRNVVVGRRRT
jgi:hypothetical protein